MTHYLNLPRPTRQVRIFDLEEFRHIGKSSMLGKVAKNFHRLSMHRNAKKLKLPQVGIKLTKSSMVKVTPKKVPYA